MNGLKEAGASLHIDHSTSNIESNDRSRFPNAVVVSSAIPHDNAEILLLHAKSVGVSVYEQDYWLANVTEKLQSYCCQWYSWSIGKSTTTNMLPYVLKAMGDDLTAVVGAHVPQEDMIDILVIQIHRDPHHKIFMLTLGTGSQMFEWRNYISDHLRPHE